MAMRRWLRLRTPDKASTVVPDEGNEEEREEGKEGENMRGKRGESGGEIGLGNIRFEVRLRLG